MTRTITDIVELYEITITPFPAYKLASVVARQDNAVRDIEQSETEVKKAEEQIDTKDEEVKKTNSELEEKLKKLEEL